MHSLFVVTSYVGTALEVAVVLLMFKHLRRWPSLLVHCTLAIGCVLVMTFTHSRVVTFYCYWGWNFTAALLRLWIMLDIVRSFPGLALWGARSRAVVVSIGILTASGAWILTASDGTAYGKEWIAASLLNDRCVAVAGAVLFGVLLVALRRLHIGWQRTGALIAAGLAVKIIGTLVTAYLLSFVRAGVLSGNVIQALSSITMLAVWVYALASYRPETYFTVASLSEL